MTEIWHESISVSINIYKKNIKTNYKIFKAIENKMFCFVNGNKMHDDWLLLKKIEAWQVLYKTTWQPYFEILLEANSISSIYLQN